ncbi:hypothetical protein LOK49_LG10G02710 [Camellia lanceoleosa]|uniref:Uncharacterized protein n=1 Tax=Camellia lanceoleosa TaxID=1840588 RepID=A0ACC0GDI3_9ERIC|nr:hypothetical protein LOK49_LG10G02710 [Camellia lanceoleosa]
MARELVQLQELRISKCAMIKEVIWKGRGEDGHATNKIEFPRLEYMSLRQLEGLSGFSLGIDEIEFPQLKTLHIKNLPNIKSFFPNESTLHSDENRNATLQSIFPQKVAFPSLENLELGGLPNVSDLWCSEISTESFSKLRFLKVEDCHGLPLIALKCRLSPGFVHTPKLQHVKVEEPNWWNAKGNQPESIWIDDLNKTIQHLFEKQQEDEEDDEEEEEEQQRIQDNKKLFLLSSFLNLFYK